MQGGHGLTGREKAERVGFLAPKYRSIAFVVRNVAFFRANLPLTLYGISSMPF